jgi:thiol-disulfide isomerase/thioredoxin
MRTSLLSIGAVLLLAACGDDTTVQPETPRRTESVAARHEDPAARFCDVSAPVGEGPTLSLPHTEGAAMPTEGWRWINVWASWCHPCLEEMPTLRGWPARLAADGAPVTLAFLSVDATPEALSAYVAATPDAPETARLDDPGGLPALLTALGLDAGATIPIHVLVDPQNHVRCARTGSITERDYETLRDIVRGR